MKRICASDIEKAAGYVIDIVTHHADGLSLSKARALAVEKLREFERYGRKTGALLVDLAVPELERQGFVKRVPLDGESDCAIDITEEGELKLLADEWAVFRDPEPRGRRSGRAAKEP